MGPIRRFWDVCSDPVEYARQWKRSTGGKVVAHTCSYAPVEILRASGALSMRLFGKTEDFTFSDGHLQAYCCSLVRGILNEALAGNLDFLDGAVFPHTCDSMQRLSDIWRINTSFSLHGDLVLPVKLNTDTAKTYMVDVLKLFMQRTGEQLGVVITGEDLEKAIQETNSTRKALCDLAAMRERSPGAVSGSDMYVAACASMIMAPSEWLDTMNSLLAELGQAAPGPPAQRLKRIVFSGGICGNTQIYDVIEKNGGVVVHDDLCTGARYYEGLVAEGTGDPVGAIAERYRTRVVCPAKHAGIYSRGQELVKIAEEKQAGGVIFLLLKFCDPHAFDYPYLKRMLDDRGIPSLLLETEDPWSIGEHGTTRVEAFMEIVRQR